MYKFVVDKSVNLPVSSDRDEDTLYYAYDKLTLFKGSVLYTDPFAVVAEVPKEGIADYMLYIVISDGSVWHNYDSRLSKIAELTDTSQLDNLKTIGTTYFLKSDYRYLDMQKKEIILPYRNGTYQLGLELADDLAIDQNLVVKFDPKNSKFIFDSNLQEPEAGVWHRIYEYTGEETDSIDTVIEDGMVKANVKISEEVDNMIKVYGDGLFVYTGNKASLDDFKKLSEQYANYKASMSKFAELSDKNLADVRANLDTIPDKILEAMNKYNNQMEAALNTYKSIAEEMEQLKSDTTTYMTTNMTKLNEDSDTFFNSVTDCWDYF